MIVQQKWDAGYPFSAGQEVSRSGVERPHVDDFPLSFVYPVQAIIQRINISPIGSSELLENRRSLTMLFKSAYPDIDSKKAPQDLGINIDVFNFN